MNYLRNINFQAVCSSKSLLFNGFENSLLNPVLSTKYFKRNYPEVKKKFYKNVTVAGTPQAYEVNLDHRKLKTPSGKILQVPNYPLALGIAQEWSSVDEKIIPPWMHLTGLSYTVTDNPGKLTKEAIVDKMLDYLEADTLLFRDESTDDFINLQAKEWDPILEWFNTKFETDLTTSKAITPTPIAIDSLTKIKKYLSVYNIWAATGLLYGVEALKSVILSLATIERRITPEKAVYLALLETEYQTDNWGAVEWAHECDKQDMSSRFAASILFTQLNSSEYYKKQKGSNLC